MRRLVDALLLVGALAADEAPAACDQDCTPERVRHALGNASAEASFLACPAGESEECICAALRLGWTQTARKLLNARMLDKVPSPALRRFAQSRRDGAAALLARLHPRYPHHLKMVPALEWAQTEELLFVRVRYARYARGEPIVHGADGLQVLWDDSSMWIVAEGDEKPLYIETSLRWRHYLRRRDGCADSEEGCRGWAAEGACDDPSIPSMQERCRRSCGLCPPANSSAAVEGFWLPVPGGVVFEAIKDEAKSWERLLEAKHPAHRIAPFEGGVELGSILECANACFDAEEGCRDATSMTCEERCRKQCAAELAAPYAVR